MYVRLLTEALYEFKSARRSVLFGLLSVLSIAGLVAYQFTPLSGEGIKSAGELLQFSVDKLSRALSASIAYKTAYYYNIIQLLFVVAFITNDMRAARYRAREVFHSRPVSNGEIVLGSFIGKLLVFTLVNAVTFGTAMLINASFYPRSFTWWAYGFYWLTLNLPTLVYLLGLAYLVTRLVRHQGGSLLLLLLLAGGLTWWGAGLWNGLPDPCARLVPNFFSDFTGHVNPRPYLLHRLFTLLAGLAFLALSLLPYPRIPNEARAGSKGTRYAAGFCLLAAVAGFLFISLHERAKERRTAYRAVYERHGQRPAARMASNALTVEELPDGGISARSEMEVENRTGQAIPLVLYLNPGLKVNTLEMEGRGVNFKRTHQAIEIDRVLQPGERVCLVLTYEGIAEPEVCYLDTRDDRYFSPGVNTLGIYRFGQRPVFCKRGYKLLTPESLWYPVSVAPYGRGGARDVNFSRYALRVKHDPRLTAIAQGGVRETGKGETVFAFTHDMPGLSLCIGKYKQRSIVVDSVRFALYYLPEHEHLLEKYNGALKDSIPGSIRSMKDVTFNSEYLRTSKYQYDKNVAAHKGIKFTQDLPQEYPYSWFCLVEVPCDFHAFSTPLHPTGERVQSGLVFLPEKMYSIAKFPARIPQNVDDMGIYMAFIGLENDLGIIANERSCDFKFLFRGQTAFFSDPIYPGTYSMLTNLACGKIRYTEENAKDYPAIAYLKQHSLQEALQDSTLSPEALENITRKKVEELHALIRLKLTDKERFKAFFLNFLTKHLFQETTTNKFYQHFQDTFGVRLDSIMERWYTSKQLPQFKIENWQCFQIIEKGQRPYYLHQFSVFNLGDVPGFVQLGEKQWIIPPHKGKRIKTKGNLRLDFPLALNLPKFQTISPERRDVNTLDTSTNEVIIDFSTMNTTRQRDEIIIDNEDPGFKIVRKENWLTSLFRDSIQEKKYWDYLTADAVWLPVIRNHFYGSPTKSAYVKRAAEGLQKVEWKTTLPQEGTYEVFFYYTTFMPPRNVSNLPPHLARKLNPGKEKAQDLHFIVFDGKKEQEVVITTRKSDYAQWLSLGTFDCSRPVYVRLSDQSLNRGETIIADAIKWVRIKN